MRRLFRDPDEAERLLGRPFGRPRRIEFFGQSCARRTTEVLAVEEDGVRLRFEDSPDREELVPYCPIKGYSPDQADRVIIRGRCGPSCRIRLS